MSFIPYLGFNGQCEAAFKFYAEQVMEGIQKKCQKKTSTLLINREWSGIIQSEFAGIGDFTCNSINNQCVHPRVSIAA